MRIYCDIQATPNRSGKKHIQDAFLFEKIPDLWHHGGICGTVKLSNQPAQKIEWEPPTVDGSEIQPTTWDVKQL